MTIYDRPDEKVMAESALAGEVQPFPDILRGWGITFEQTGGLPPMEWANYVARRTDQAIRYFMQRGLPEWSPTEDYPQGAYVQYAGEGYLSKRANTGKQPGAAGSTNDWGRWSITRDEFEARAGSHKQAFTSSGSFTVPDGITKIYVTACAAGGGGGGGCGSAPSQVGWPATGGGGGCGQAVVGQTFAVVPGQVIPITVGGKGLGGAGGPANGAGSTGTSGGNTVIGSLLTLTGGLPGGGGTSPTTAGAGNGGGGSPCKGSPGSQAGAGGQGGTGASSRLGGGGGGGQPIATSVIAGAAGGVGDIGGGGGGGGTTVVSSIAGGAGGNGGDGFALIEW